MKFSARTVAWGTTRSTFSLQLLRLPPIWPFSHLRGGNVPLPRPRDYELREDDSGLPPGETRILSPPGDNFWLE